MSNSKARERFVEYLLERMLSRASGKDVTRVFDEKPNRKFFIGTLSPHADDSGVSRAFTKISPTRVGLEGLLDESALEKSTIRIKISGAFYQRVFPTFVEQIEYTKKRFPPLDSEDRTEDENADEESQAGEIREVYEKRKLPPIVIERKLIDLFQHKTSNEIEVQEVSSEVRDFARKSTDSAGLFPNLDRKSRKIPKAAIATEEAFDKFLKSIEEDAIDPIWDLTCSVEATRFRGMIKVSVVLQNAVRQGREQDSIDSSFFECELEMEVVGSVFSPYVLDYLKDDFRYDGNIEANGINCCAVRRSPNIIACEHAPVYRQKRFKSTEKIQPEFSDLCEDPVPVLRSIEKKMVHQIGEMESRFKTMVPQLPEKGTALFKQELADFRREKSRFSQGIECLERKDKIGDSILEAFKLMNKTFSISSKKFKTWRLFQIVFITMLIPDVISVHDKKVVNFRDFVDVIYFPTGGGKTEAYLGTVVLQIFFDRLIGKTQGVSAITRFPLRLLSLQQLQRIADIFAKAETIRRSHKIIGQESHAPFTTGYFVGGENTPNRIYKKNTRFETVDCLTPINAGLQEKEKYRIIVQCPFCGVGNVELNADLQSLRIEHVCQEPSCGEILPIIISDYEIYRYLPTFIVGTVDKTAVCGFQRFFRHIFGRVDKLCPDHGFFSGGRCLQHEDCDREDADMKDVNLLDPTPSLLIQDEMHLIRESLGSYSSHYESFIDEYMKRSSDGEKRLKIIAATATISRYGYQLEQLYNRQGFKFPSQGPDIHESFYAYSDQDEIARIVVGVIPHNKTVIFAVLDVLRFYWEEILRLSSDPSALLNADFGFESQREAEETLEHYRLMLSYNLVKLEGDAIAQSIKTMVNPRLREKGLDEISTARLTGDVVFQDVREVLNAVQNPKQGEEIGLIVATSMISHGVDIDPMNFMVFRGMPRNNAEYIQASSRVGRKFPGLILVIFNHTRERDQSYYKYFHKFHEFQPMLVEPVPISRWAKFTIERTIPGIFCAAILNHFEPEVISQGARGLYMTPFFSDAYRKGLITEAEIKKFLHSSYCTDRTDWAHHFKNVIEDRTATYINDLLSHEDNLRFVSMAISDSPMTSLRDTDVPVMVVPARESFAPMDSVGSTRTRREE